MPRIVRQRDIPSVQVYIDGLLRLGEHVTAKRLELLTSLYHAPDRAATTTQLAQMVGIPSYQGVNAQMGILGRLFCVEMKIVADNGASVPKYWSIWSQGWRGRDGFFYWQMLPEVAEALETLGWVSGGEVRLPEEVTGRFLEGATTRITVNRYERDRNAREACIRYWGRSCVVCDFNFEDFYGPLGKEYIHVHHLEELSLGSGEYEVDPRENLRPVCPNCHAMLHRKRPALGIEALREVLRERSSV